MEKHTFIIECLQFALTRGVTLTDLVYKSGSQSEQF